MNKYYVVTGTPVKKVRNAQNRNQRKLSKRLSRLGDVITVTTESGTLKAYTPDQVTHKGNVKRDAERYAKKTGGTFVAL